MNLIAVYAHAMKSVVAPWGDKPNDILIFGKSYTPEYDLRSIKTNEYKSNEINDTLAKKTVGLPVFIEHDDRYPVGHVADSFVDERRNLNSFLYVSGNRAVNEQLLSGAIAIDPMTNKRFYSGLSMGTQVALDVESKPYVFVQGVTPKEISIVQEPDRPNAFIQDYWVVPKHVEEPKEFVESITRKYDRFFD